MSTPSHNPVSPRPATLDDLEQVLTIENASYPAPWSLEHFKQELDKSYSRVMVLTDDETDSVVVGYIVYWLQVEGVTLHNVTVSAKWRGNGYAKQLLSLMINEAVRDDLPRVSLEVRSNNTAAIKLYQTMGFQKTHERAGFYKNGDSALVMELKTSDVDSRLH